MEIITMEEKGYKELIDIVFEKLRELLGKELLKANNQLIQNDECRIKANEIQKSLSDLLRQYRPELTYAPISMPQFKTKETYKQIMKNQDRHHELKIYLNEKKLIIKTQIDALDGRELDQQKLLAGYGILHKKKYTIKPITTKMLYKILDLPADTELFGGTDQ